MPSLRQFTVSPKLPAALARLQDLVNNLYWAWAPETQELFVRIDPDLWEKVHGNPVELLGLVSQARLEELAHDEAFVFRLERAAHSLDEYMARRGWFAQTFPDKSDATIAYFSMEYGLHESIPIYSGGLGVLAGDHLKTASDLGLPLVGIGLAYAEGYFRQVLTDDGYQTENYPLNDWNKMPVSPVLGKDGTRLMIHVRYPHGMVTAQLWKVQVGRVPLYLLDANLPENSADDRTITGPLYGGDREFRVRQEIMLGIGGIHALWALGISPRVCHMNEGHSAFLGLERIRRGMEELQISFDAAREASAAGTVFTTHTPVPAGNDIFDRAMVMKYLEPYREPLGLTADELMNLGVDPTLQKDLFSMPVLAIRTADGRNGVSALHGEVSRAMYKDLWPELPVHEVPVESVTNGIHVASWLSDEMSGLYTRYFGDGWRTRTDDAELWRRIFEIPDTELWATHVHRRQRLVTLCRKRLRTFAERRDANPTELAICDEVLDPHALTVGFARRFATYKRANLLLSDIDRLKRLVADTKRPIQFVFAGKAHPQDKLGKDLIREIVRASRDADLRGKIVFLEDYDMRVARSLVAGVDVWLNTPRRPMEASGTSGMKAAANGVLNVSVLDGWWAEAWKKHGWPIGWAVGHGEEYHDLSGDRIEAEALYDLLEREIVPLFYDRVEDNLPRRWIHKMKSTIAACAADFNTVRMVKEYAGNYYVPAVTRWRELTGNGAEKARELSEWRARVKSAFGDVAVRSFSARGSSDVSIGEPLLVEARVALGTLKPSDVRVEAYSALTHGSQTLSQGHAFLLTHVAHEGEEHVYRGEIRPDETGTHGFSVRVLPNNALLPNPFSTALLRWA